MKFLFQVPIISNFSYPSSKNVWRIKDRDCKNNSYILYNKALRTYIKAPYEAITAFLDEGNADYEILVAGNFSFRKLLQQDLELQDLQLQVEQLKLDKTTGASNNDY